MVNWKKIFLLAFTFVINLYAIAQNGQAATEGNSIMVSNGKIYVVMAIVITILVGILFYLVRLDRKISKMERGER